MAHNNSLTPLFSLQRISHIFEPLYILTLMADATESIHRPFFAVWLRQKFHIHTHTIILPIFYYRIDYKYTCLCITP